MDVFPEPAAPWINKVFASSFLIISFCSFCIVATIFFILSVAFLSNIAVKDSSHKAAPESWVKTIFEFLILNCLLNSISPSIFPIGAL